MRGSGSDQIVGLDLEPYEVGLTKYGRVDRVHRGDQKISPQQRFLALLEQSVGDQDFGEHRGGLSERQAWLLGQQKRLASECCRDVGATEDVRG